MAQTLGTVTTAEVSKSKSGRRCASSSRLPKARDIRSASQIRDSNTEVSFRNSKQTKRFESGAFIKA
jgi:hypothetical protein